MNLEKLRVDRDYLYNEKNELIAFVTGNKLDFILDLDLNTIDLDVVNKLGLNNILIIPLIVQKETIGVYTFMNSEKDLDIKWKEAREILNFCRHLSGTINSIRLYLEYNPSMELE